MPLYDCHTHTNHSHDSRCSLDDLCEAACAAGLAGISVTDHADIEYARTSDVRERVRASFLDADAHRTAYAGRLRVLRGVEIGEGLWDPESTAQILSDSPFDVVIGSVHAVRMAGYERPYSCIDFGGMPRELIPVFLHTYFDDMLDMVQHTDMDILAHVTCPLRYIVGKYGIPVDMVPYGGQIDEILKAAAARGLALEVNTSCTGSAYDSLLPYEEILRRFRRFGGTRFTVGSDCHTADRCGLSFPRAVTALRAVGVCEAVYFENRRPVPYALG